MADNFRNILLVSGSGRNVGKTTFVSHLISSLKNKSVTAVKISHHFHKPTSGLIKLKEGNGWIINEEANQKSDKDSSLFLQAGAIKSFYIQSEKNRISEMFENLKRFLPINSPVIIESGGLVDLIEPGLFILIRNNESQNKSLQTRNPVNRLEIISTGTTFYPDVKSIIFDKEWKIIK